MRAGVLAIALLAIGCARQEAIPVADPSNPAQVFMNVCAAPGLTAERVERYAQSDAWTQESGQGDFERDERAERAWTTTDRAVRLMIGGYNLDKWFAWPLDNDPRSLDCKVEFNGGEPREIIRALRGAGFRDINRSRPAPVDGWEGLVRYSPDGAEHPGRSLQLAGHGCVVFVHADLEPRGAPDWYSRELTAHCRG